MNSEAVPLSDGAIQFVRKMAATNTKRHGYCPDCGAKYQYDEDGMAFCACDDYQEEDR